MLSRIKVYGRRLGDVLLPSACMLCGMRTQGALLCAPCTADLPWNTSACPGCALPQAQGVLCPTCQQQPRAFDAAFAAFVLQAPVQQGIHALKYQAQFFQSSLLATAAAQQWRTTRSSALPGVLIPVPLHWRRQWSRGYNQSLELARVLGAQLGIVVDASAARRLRATPDQIGQSALQRRRNLHGAFAVSGVAGRHIALVDDVMTTGATLEELARVCKAAGAARVEAWAIARQPLTAKGWQVNIPVT